MTVYINRKNNKLFKVENDLEKEETNIMTDWNIYTLPSGGKYYKIDDQFLKLSFLN